ncbi:membrane hypothetical protein [Candidatus Sulfopaludibacter sp. SbA4]|nr:membrane hypothetical protein [Candidatus Sulfopaludibacter sp. SbA4]
MLLAMALAAVLGNQRESPRLLIASWIAFAVLSAAFGVGWAPFTDARYLGHEARETLTYALTAIPLAIAACSYLANPRAARRSAPRYAPICFAAFVALALYQAAGAMAGGIRQHAQSTDPVRLVCTHFFEHTLSLFVVTSHSCLLYWWASGRGKR